MPFQTDPQMSRANGPQFGEYMVTFLSDTGQVRADLFRRAKVVTAHVSFPTGLDGTKVTDRYYSVLMDYARENGIESQFKVIYSDKRY
jgi:hypothetical protein